MPRRVPIWRYGRAYDETLRAPSDPHHVLRAHEHARRAHHGEGPRRESARRVGRRAHGGRKPHRRRPRSRRANGLGPRRPRQPRLRRVAGRRPRVRVDRERRLPR